MVPSTKRVQKMNDRAGTQNNVCIGKSVYFRTFDIAGYFFFQRSTLEAVTSKSTGPCGILIVMQCNLFTLRTMGSQVIYGIRCVSCESYHIWTHCKGAWDSAEWSQGYLWSSRVAICSCISNQSSSGQENCCCAYSKYNILLYASSLF